jgi:hypothetical protein
MALTLAEKIETWSDLESALKKMKADEMKLRKEICEEVFKGRQGQFTEKVDIGHSILTASSKTTLSLDEEILENIWGDLDELEQSCIKFKPNLLKTPLAKISEKSELWDCIVEKPSAPTLSIKDKK